MHGWTFYSDSAMMPFYSASLTSLASSCLQLSELSLLSRGHVDLGVVLAPCSSVFFSFSEIDHTFDQQHFEATSLQKPPRPDY